jgi:hypothetical protein
MQSTNSGRPQFSIATIFVATTLLSISLAAAWYVPCLGFVLLFVGPPACVRAAIVGYYHRRAGKQLTVGDKVEIVVESVYAALMAIVLSLPAGVAAFVFSLWCSTFPQELTLDGNSGGATSHAAVGRRK